MRTIQTGMPSFSYYKNKDINIIKTFSIVSIRSPLIYLQL